jgi:DHA2 family multidrug resistance protein
MENTSTMFTPDVVSGILDMEIQQQAFMLSTNDLSILAAWGFLALIPVIYLCKRVSPAPSSSPQVAH